MGAASAEPAVRTRVRLCGPLALAIDGRDAIADVPAGQARSLLAYMLTRPSVRRARRADRDGVAGGVPKDPQADLRVILTRLAAPWRRPRSKAARSCASPCPSPVWVDATPPARRSRRRVRTPRARRGADARACPGGAGTAAAGPPARPGGRLGPGAAPRARSARAGGAEWTARGGLALGGAELAGAQRAARELVSRSAFREAGHRLLMEAWPPPATWPRRSRSTTSCAACCATSSAWHRPRSCRRSTSGC